MANQNTIELRLVVKDDGTVVVQQFGKNAQQAMQNVDKSASTSGAAMVSLKSSWIAVTAAAAGAGIAFDKAFQYIEMGAKAMQAEASFHAMTGAMQVDSSALLAAMQAATVGTVDDTKLMQKAVFAMTQDIDPEKLPQLFEAARVAARRTGVDVGQAADLIIQAVSTNMPRGLKQMGAITKEQMELFNRAFAAGRTEVNTLDFVILNAAVHAGEMGVAAVDAAEGVQQFKKEMIELREAAGKGLISALASAWFAMKKFGSNPQTDLLTGENIPGAVTDQDQAAARAAADTQKLWEQTESGVATAAAAKFALDKKMAEEKAAIAAIRIAEDKAKNLKSIDDLRLKEFENVTKAGEAEMKGSYAREFEIAQYNVNRQIDMDNMAYQQRIAEINAEADALWIKDQKFFDRQKYVAGQMKVLDQDRLTRLSAEDAAIENLITITKLYNDETARQKSLLSLEALKAINTTYFDMEDSRIKYEEQLNRSYYENDLELARRSIQQSLLIADERLASKREEIEQEARYRTEDERQRISDTLYIAEKMKAIEAETVNAKYKLNYDMLVNLKAEYERTLLGGSQKALYDIHQEYTNEGQLMGDFMKRTFSSSTDALTDFVMTGKRDFSDLRDSIIKDLVRIQIQENLMGPMAGWFNRNLLGSNGSSGLLGLLGLGGGGAASSNQDIYNFTYTNPTYEGAEWYDLGGFHRGGMGNEPTFYRLLPNLDLLPRHHKGLGPGERLSVTTDDEMTLTPGQQKAMWKIAQSTGAASEPRNNFTIPMQFHFAMPINNEKLAAALQKGIEKKLPDIVTSIMERQF